jgi:hypothetical protein
VTFVALIFASVCAAAPPQIDVSDASLGRVRAALAKPPSKLTLRERVPDFSVTIRERSRDQQLLPPILDFTVGPGVPQQMLFTSPYGSQPLFRVDLMPAAMAAAAGIKQLRQAYARRGALEEVRRTIAEYCAAQPGGGAGIEICSK